MAFGWGASFGRLGSGGGNNLPPAISDILQWMQATSDGLTIPDKLDPDIVDLAEVRDCACGNFSPSGVSPGEREVFVVSNSIDFSDTGFILECVININQNTVTQSIASQQAGTGTGYTILGVLSNGFLWSQFGTPDSTFSVLAKPTVGTDHAVKLEYNATTDELTCTIDGSSETKTSVAGDVPSNGDIVWGSNTVVGGQWYQGLLADCKMSIPESSIEPVFLFAGQSNMVAFSLVPPPSEIATSSQHKFTYSVNGTTGTDEVLQAVDTTRWSTELVIGNAISTPHTFIKVAVGGTNLYSDWQSGGDEYNLFVTTVNTAFDAIYARGKVPFVRGMIWMQGESDANTGQGADYYNNFHRFWGDFTAEVNIPRETPVILSKLGANGAPASYPFGSLVISAQEQLGGLSYITTINTDDATYQDTPLVHHDSDGLVLIGNDMAVAAQALPSVSGDLSVFECPISELTGDEIFDVSGNQKNTAITIGGGGVGHSSAVFRSLTQDKFSYSLKEGFSNRLVLDGTAYVTTTSGSDLSGGFTFRASGRVDDLTAENNIWSIVGVRIMLGVSAIGQFFTRMGDSGFEALGGIVIAEGDSYDLVFTHDGDTTATLTITIDEVTTVATNTTVPAEASTVAYYLGVSKTALSNFYIGLLASATLDGVFSYSSFPSATTVSDQLGSNDGTITNGAVMAVPALLNGSKSADGNLITNFGGYTNNGFEGTITQTDADFAIFGAVSSFWGNGVDTWDAKTFTNFVTNHVNGTNGLWFKWYNIVGVCHIVEAIQYPVAQSFTEREYNQLVRWTGDVTCGAGAMTPFLLTDGTPFLLTDGGVFLVNPA
jgi:hypothetical protein